MNNKTLANLLRQPYEKGKSWIRYIEENNYSPEVLNEFCNEKGFNLNFHEERFNNENYLCAKMGLIFSPTISGWFEFNSECNIDNSADEEDFIEKLLLLIEEAEYIKEQQMK